MPFPLVNTGLVGLLFKSSFEPIWREGKQIITPTTSSASCITENKRLRSASCGPTQQWTAAFCLGSEGTARSG